MDKKLDTLYDLCEIVSHELEEAKEKIHKSGGKLSAGDTEYLETLTSTMKSLKETIGMIESEGSHYSGRYWEENRYSGANMNSDYRRMSNARGLGSSYANRYSREGAKDEFMAEIYELMNKAPDETTRRKFERFINEM